MTIKNFTQRRGRKTLEVRVGYKSINRIQKGDHVSLATHAGNFEVEIKDIRLYDTFEEMLNSEPWQQIAPDSESQDEVLVLLKRIYPADKERLGVVVFEFVQERR